MAFKKIKKDRNFEIDIQRSATPSVKMRGRSWTGTSAKSETQKCSIANLESKTSPTGSSNQPPTRTSLERGWKRKIKKLATRAKTRDKVAVQAVEPDRRRAAARRDASCAKWPMRKQVNRVPADGPCAIGPTARTTQKLTKRRRSFCPCQKRSRRRS